MAVVDVNPRPILGQGQNLLDRTARGAKWLATLPRRPAVERRRAARPGITVNGIASPNAAILVTLADQQLSVVACALGHWSAKFVRPELPFGTVEIPVSATTTNVAGQVSCAKGVVEVDNLDA